MPQPTEPTGAANVLVIGTTGSGKSTLANLLVYGEDAPENGFVVGDGADSETSELNTMTSELGACVVQVTDTPGVPDTDRKKSLRHYDEMIEYLRKAPWINAIIIMVAEGRKDERVYRDMRALLKQFNTLPCGKIMVFRSTLPPRCSDERRRNKDRLAHEAMDKLCTSAGLPFAMRCVLHNMDERELQNLRKLVCKMPASPLPGPHLRTFSEIRTDFENLSHQNSRMEALEKELERLAALKAENEMTVQKLDRGLKTRENIELGAHLAIGLAAAMAFGKTAGTTALVLLHMSSSLPAMQEEKTNAEARVEEISEDMAGKQAELHKRRVNQGDLARAKAEFDELDSLCRD